MKVILKIEESVPAGKPLAKIEVIVESEEELKMHLEEDDSWLPKVISLLASAGIVLMKEVCIVILPPVRVITLEMILPRLLLLGFTERQREVLVMHCNNKTRKQMADELSVSIDCIDSHFKNVFLIIGKFNLQTLKDVLTCSDELFLLKYSEKIEDFKRAT